VPGPVLAVLVGLAVCQFGLFLTTIVLHRALSHRAITLRPGPLFAARVALWITTGIRPRQWAAVHRRHHAYTDVEGDPHSPLLEGFAMVLFANAALYRRYAKDPAIVERYARDLPPDRWDRMLFDRALVGLSIGIGLLFLVFWGNPELVAIAAVTHVVSFLLLNAAVNSFGHSVGRRPYEGLATNSQWLAWLAAGEGLHSNHHAAPTSARLSFRRGEHDPGWWVIATMRRLGWVTVRHAEARIKASARAAEMV
jgi:stearoyl-CoA desaturase (delta-9 desaturase)